jgi:hypothetical protein
MRIPRPLRSRQPVYAELNHGRITFHQGWLGRRLFQGPHIGSASPQLSQSSTMSFLRAQSNPVTATARACGRQTDHELSGSPAPTSMPNSAAITRLSSAATSMPRTGKLSADAIELDCGCSCPSSKAKPWRTR